jgi:hypothetical protein
MITEYCDGGSIRSLLTKYGRFNENIVRLYVKQIIDGLAYLNAHGIYGSVLDSSGVLVDNHGVVKISHVFDIKKRSRKVHWDHVIGSVNAFPNLRCLFVNLALLTIEIISKDYSLIYKEGLTYSYIYDCISKMSCSELCKCFIIDCLNASAFDDFQSHEFLISTSDYEHEEDEITSEVHKPRERIYNILNTSEDNPMFSVSMTLNTPQSKLGRIFTNFLNTDRREVSPVDEIDSSKEYSPKDEEKKFFNEIL